MVAGNAARTAAQLARTCPGRSVLDHVAGKWGVLVLTALHERSLRYAELRNRLPGISEKVLAQNLRALVEDGLIARTVHESRSPKVSYALTDLGVGVSRPLLELVDWIDRHSDDIVAARRTHARRADRLGA